MSPDNRQVPLPFGSPCADEKSRWALFPKTRYLGSKRKLLPLIDRLFATIELDTALDPFCGTGAVAYLLKSRGKGVTASDAMAYNAAVAKALIENDDTVLGSALTPLLEGLPSKGGRRGFVERTFDGLFYFKEENRFIDGFLERLRSLEGYRHDLALFALGQACLAKRPYNLFHRANLNMREREVTRSFGNKTTWDRPFHDHIVHFAAEADAAVHKGSRPCRALQCDVLAVPDVNYDLVYLDPPYVPKSGVAVDYLDYYHFLEGLAAPETWAKRILHRYKHKPLKGRGESPWSDPRRITAAFEAAIRRFSASTLVISYRSDGIPSIEDLALFLTRAGKKTEIIDVGKYTYALSRNRASHEVLLVGR